MPRPTHDEAGVPLPPVPPVLREPTDADVTYTHDRGGSPISPFHQIQDIEQPVKWRVGDDEFTDAAEAVTAHAAARSQAVQDKQDPDVVLLEEVASEVTHDPKGTPKPPFPQGAVDDVGEDDSIVELNSKPRNIRGQRDRIDSQESAERRVRSDAAFKALEDDAQEAGDKGQDDQPAPVDPETGVPEGNHPAHPFAGTPTESREAFLEEAKPAKKTTAKKGAK